MDLARINDMKRKMDLFETLMFIMVLLYTLSIIFVLYFGLLNSLKDFLDFETGNVFGLPRAEFGGWRFENYIDVFNKCRSSVIKSDGMYYVYIEEMFFNSFTYSVLSTLIGMASQIVVAYAVAKYDFKLKKVYYNVAIIVMLIPIIGSLPSQMQFAEALGLKNSVLGICIMQAKYTGLYFLVFYSTFKGISWTYAEAAQIDGAGHFKVFIEVMLPLVRSSLFAVFILQFIGNWNDYYTPMLFIPEKVTIAYGLYIFKSTTTDTAIRTPVILGASFLSCIPIIALFIIFRNQIMGKVNIGGMKG
jgi:ABC-type glycerol-3-phosphate transport system permease component